IYDSYNLTTYELFLRIMFGNLSAGFPNSYLLTKIYLQLVCRLPSLWKVVYFHDCTHPQIYLFKITPTNLHRLKSVYIQIGQLLTLRIDDMLFLTLQTSCQSGNQLLFFSFIVCKIFLRKMIILA